MVTPKPPNLTRVPPFPPPSQTYSRTNIFLAKLLKGYDINPNKGKDKDHTVPILHLANLARRASDIRLHRISLPRIRGLLL